MKDPAVGETYEFVDRPGTPYTVIRVSEAYVILEENDDGATVLVPLSLAPAQLEPYEPSALKRTLKRVRHKLSSLFGGATQGTWDAVPKGCTVVLHFNEEIIERMDDVVRLSDAEGYGEVIRRSLTLYDTMTHETNAGSVLYLHRPDGTKQEVLLVF